MRQHEPDEILALFFEEADIGHDEIDAGQMLLIAKGDPEIDRKPGALMAVGQAIDRQVHADLADAPQGSKGQFIRPRHQAAPMEAAEAEIAVARRDRNPLAARRPDNQATLFIDGVEYAFHDGSARLDRDRLAEPGRALQPEPADFAKAAAMVPKSAEFRPGVRQSSE